MGRAGERGAVSTRVVVYGSMAVVLIGVVGALGLTVLWQAGQTASPVPHSQLTPAASDLPRPTPLDEMTLPVAIASRRGDWGTSSEWDQGSQVFARYTQKQLTETNITKLPETLFGLMHKDPDLELGKHVCFDGEVIEIYAQPFEGLKMYQGGMWDGEDAVRFLTPWGTDGIIKGVKATFCGVFTGLMVYLSTTNQQVRAVKLVGAFRLGKASK